MPFRILLTVAASALLSVTPTGAHTTTASWTEFDTQQRLTIGRFAAANGIAYASQAGATPSPRSEPGATGLLRMSRGGDKSGVSTLAQARQPFVRVSFRSSAVGPLGVIR